MNILEAASPWMNEKEIRSKISPQDFRIGFEFEFIAIKKEEDEDIRFDNAAYTERLDEIIDDYHYTDDYFNLIPSKIAVLVDEADFNEYAPSENTDDQKIDLTYILYHYKHTFEQCFPYVFPAGNEHLNNWKAKWDALDDEEFNSKLENIIGVDVEFDYEVYAKICNDYFELSQKYLLAEDHEMNDFLSLICFEDADGSVVKSKFFEKAYDICRTKIEELSNEYAERQIDRNDYTERNNTYDVRYGVYDRIKSAMQANQIANYDDVEEYDDYQNTGDGWAIKDDTSIKNFGDNVSIEISTPTFDLDDGIDTLTRMFSLIDNIGYTNNSTGLHISIDQVSVSKESQNWLKMTVLFDDVYFTSQFGRTNNSYTNSLRKFLKGIDIKHYKKFNNLDVDSLEYDFKMDYLKGQRNSTINFNNENYYEFRVAGGTDYQKKLKEVVSDIYKFCELIRVSSTDEHDEEYLKRLHSFIFRGGNRSNNQDSMYQNKEYFENLVDGTYSNVTGYMKFITSCITIGNNPTMLARIKYVKAKLDKDMFNQAFAEVLIGLLTQDKAKDLEFYKIYGFDYLDKLNYIYSHLNHEARMRILPLIMKLDLHTIRDETFSHKLYDDAFYEVMTNYKEHIDFINTNSDMLLKFLADYDEDDRKRIMKKLGLNTENEQ